MEEKVKKIAKELKCSVQVVSPYYKRIRKKILQVPSNMILRTTIETNYDSIPDRTAKRFVSYAEIPKAPLPSQKFAVVKKIRNYLAWSRLIEQMKIGHGTTPASQHFLK